MGVPAHQYSPQGTALGLTPGRGAPTVVGFTGVTTTLPSPWVNDDTPRGNVEGPVPTSAPEAVALGLWTPPSEAHDADIFGLPSPEGSPILGLEQATIGVLWCVVLRLSLIHISEPTRRRGIGVCRVCV